MSYFADHLAWQ